MNFLKYTANGNDFILLHNPDSLPVEAEIARLCDRHFGVGADGMLVLSSHEESHRMRIFNSDGREADMCANGLRIAFTYLNRLGEGELRLSTKNGFYSARMIEGRATVEMTEITDEDMYHIEAPGFLRSYYVSTGVPHIVLLTESVSVADFKKTVLPYRHHPELKNGANVNLVEVPTETEQFAIVRTFERGVEGETLSCGTGMTATALALRHWFHWKDQIRLRSKGGDHLVELGEKVYYSGDVQLCFEGKIEW